MTVSYIKYKLELAANLDRLIKRRDNSVSPSDAIIGGMTAILLRNFHHEKYELAREHHKEISSWMTKETTKYNSELAFSLCILI